MKRIFGFLLLSVFLFSCSDSIDSHGSNFLLNEKPYILKGSVKYSDNEELSGRMAIPATPVLADYISDINNYKFKVSHNGDPKNGVTFDNSGNFSLQLNTGDNEIKIEVEKKVESSPVDWITILRSTETITIGANSPHVLSKNFVLKKLQTEGKKGNVKLEINCSNAGVDYVTATLVETDSTKISNWQDALNLEDGKLIWEAKNVETTVNFPSSGNPLSINSGSYRVKFDFYDNEENKNILYSRIQTIEVYDSLLTNKWYEAGSQDGPVDNNNGTFTVDQTAIQNFINTTVYVDPHNGSDTNGGTYYGKLKTLQKAVDTVVARNNIKSGTEEFNIYLCGDIEGDQSQNIDINCSSKALNLNIKCDSTDTSVVRRIYGRTGQKRALIRIKGKSTSDTIINFERIIINSQQNITTSMGAEDQGGGFYVNKAKLTLTRCNVCGHVAKYGAGIYCDTGAQVIAESGTYIASNNTESGIDLSGRQGGGIYAAGDVTVKCQVSYNKAENGGAVYVTSDNSAKIKFDNGAILSYSSYISNLVRVIENDVFLKDGKTVTVGSDLTNTTVAYITPEKPAKNLEVLSSTSDKFKTSYAADSYKISEKKLILANIITDIYVGTRTVNGTTYAGVNPTGNTKDDSTWTHYNSSADYFKTHPLTTIEKALQFITWQGSNQDYKIYITGTLNGAQTIANNSVTNSPITLTKNTNIKKLTLTGASSGTLDGGFAKGSGGNSDKIGTTLTIDTDVPIEMTSLTIKNGYQPSGTGGGIYIKNTNADVTLKSGVTVYGQANKGGCVYNKGTLTIDGATIRDGYALVYGSGNNASACGGGIYNEKNLYMKSGYIQYCKAGPGDSDTKGDGAGVYSTGSSTVFDMTGGYIYNGNAAKDKGGGVYIGGGSTFYMSGSAYIGSSNPSGVATSGSRDNQAQFGGGLYVDQASKAYLGYLKNGTLADTFSGGIRRNYAVSSGGGIYISTGTGAGKDGQVHMAKGVISHNAAGENATNSTAGGGGVQTSISGGTKSLFEMTGGTVCNNRAAAGGGVYATGKFVMEGGSLENNDLHSLPTEKKGGAVYVGTSGVFEVKGDVSIPYGGSKDNNDVYISAQLSNGKVNYGTTITITDSLSDNVSIYVTPQTYTDAGYKWFSESSNGYISAHYKKFHVTPNSGPYYVSKDGKIDKGVIVSSENDFSTAVNQLTQDGDKIVFDNGGAVVTSFSYSARAALNDSSKKIHLDLTQVSGNPALDGYTTIQELSVNGASFFGESGKVMVKNCSSLKTINIYGSSTIENGNYPSGFGTLNFISDCSSFEAFNFVDATSVCLVGGLLNIWKVSSQGNTPRYIRTDVINIYIPESATNIEIHDRFEIQGTNLNAFEYVRFIYKGSLTKLKNDVTITRVRYSDSMPWKPATTPDGVDIYYNDSTTQCKRWKPTAGSAYGALY